MGSLIWKIPDGSASFATAIVRATRCREDSDDQTQRCAATTEEDIRIQHRFRPDMERFTGFQRRIDGAILLVNRDVFQRPGVMMPLSSAVSASEP